jgi:hypothetical protein
MKSSVIKGHYRSYADAYAAVGKRFLNSRKFSIQHCLGAGVGGNMYPWVLIYYGNFHELAYPSSC